MSKFKGQRDQIQEALETLEEHVSAFQFEIEFCSHLRLGRMDEKFGQLYQGLHSIHTQMERCDKILLGGFPFATAANERLLYLDEFHAFDITSSNPGKHSKGKRSPRREATHLQYAVPVLLQQSPFQSR